MKNFFVHLLRLICVIYGVFFLIAGVTLLILCFADHSTPFVFKITFTLILLGIGIGLFYIAIKKIDCKGTKTSSKDNVKLLTQAQLGATQETLNPSSDQLNEPPSPSKTIGATIGVANTTYIETDSTIQRADGKPFSDEEVPYLMQLSYEKILQREGIYNGEVLDLTYLNEDLPKKRFQTAIPSYQELCNIPPNTSNVSILSTDIFFLKYLDGRTFEHPDIAQYWYYDYGLNYSDEIKKLVSAGLLTITNINLKKLKVDDLKDILRHFELPLSGKKDALQKRILENIGLDELSSFLGNSTHYFCSTDNGSELIKTVHESATFNLELENEAISLITKNNYAAAYCLIWKQKSQNPANKNLSPEYPQYRDAEFHSIMDSHAFFYTLEKDRELETKIRAAVVFCRMYGLGQDNIKKIIKRIYVENHHEFSSDAKNIISGRLL